MNKKYVIIGISSILILILITTITIVLTHNPIKLEKTNITLEYGKKYKEPGFSAQKFGKNYTKKIKTKNNINYKKIGTYEKIYILKVNGITYKKTRKINIVDSKKPKITLKGNKNTDVCPGKEYEEEGFEVTDNYDKNLEKKVKKDIKKDFITYKVTDSSGNKTQIKRNLFYQDKTKPEIKLNGSENINIFLGSTYSEEGATALDNCDGDITQNIQKDGTINQNKIGTYKITYKVKDSKENETSIIRTINVINRPSLNDGRPGTIYLTFDDGPNEGTTNVILDILKEEGIKATFFVTNKGPDYLIKREYDEGHTVALHTATHNYSILYSSDENYYNDLYSVQERVKRITGYTSTIIRFPGGTSNTVSRNYSPGIMTRLSQSTLEKGFKYYDWNISSGDAGNTRDPNQIYNNVVNSLRKERANMVLMHDIKTYTRDALRRIIQYGKNSGYTFEKITTDTPMITQRVNN